MIDRNKVIKGLECCVVQTDDFPPLCEECPYRDDKIGSCEYYHDILSDALTLLKADQAELIRQHERNIAPTAEQRWSRMMKKCEGDRHEKNHD